MLALDSHELFDVVERQFAGMLPAHPGRQARGCPRLPRPTPHTHTGVASAWQLTQQQQPRHAQQHEQSAREPPGMFWAFMLLRASLALPMMLILLIVIGCRNCLTIAQTAATPPHGRHALVPHSLTTLRRWGGAIS